MNANELLDPAYRWFMDEPSSNWTLHTLADIRARVSATWAPP
ncbi:lipase, partial [Pseudomonas syringae pv. japonica str. M301072]